MHIITTNRLLARARRNSPAWQSASRAAATAANAAVAIANAIGGESAITRTRPCARVVKAGFTKIFHPAALAGSAAAPLAWYGLRRLRVPSIAAQFNLTGLKFDCRSPRTADVGGVGQPKAWATSGGHDAMIVVGRNLSFLTIGGWIRYAEGYVLTGNNEIGGEGTIDDRILTTMTFPGGSFADATPAAGTMVREFGLEAFQFTTNDTLDVALCVLASKVSSGNATNYLDGFADLELKISTLRRSRSFDE